MILTHCLFIVVWPRFSCNGLCKEGGVWRGGGGEGRAGGREEVGMEDQCHLKVPAGLRFNKHQMTDVIGLVKSFANTFQLMAGRLKKQTV